MKRARATKRVMALAIRVACDKEGNSDGGKSNIDKNGRGSTVTRATTRATATAMATRATATATVTAQQEQRRWQ
jgi:hypothetical protein